MKLVGFQVYNFRNIIDSGWVAGGDLVSFIAQNECGKSNLLEAFYKLNPYRKDEKYLLSEDWPADKWPPPKTPAEELVCRAKFRLTLDEYRELLEDCDLSAEDGAGKEPVPRVNEENSPLLEVQIDRFYSNQSQVTFHANLADTIDEDEAVDWILKRLPKFVYMADYAYFNGSTELTDLRTRLQNHGGDRSKLNKEDQTVLVVLDLAGINLEELISKSNAKDQRTIRGYDTRQASAYLSRQFEKLWGQKDVRFDIRVDGPTLDVTVEDKGLGMPVRLHRRSRGFQWFVSFTWMFTHASQGEYENCLLLLDEPGVHLHPGAHRDLLNFLENLSKTNTVLYTTHLSTMLDPAFPERVRIMEVKDHHAHVENSMYSRQAEPMMVIEQVLGLSPDMSGLLGARQTLIVEGGEDAVILEKLSGLLARTNAQDGLSDRIYLMPAKGAQKTPMYAGFMVGHKFDAGVLLDSDPAGEAARQKIKELYLDGIAEENNSRFRVLMLGPSAGIEQQESAIEDLFTPEFFVDAVAHAYRIKLDLNELPTDGSEQITKRVERVLKSRGVAEKIDKRRVLLEILERFNNIKTLKDLPQETIARAKSLFQKINRAFADKPKESSKAKPSVRGTKTLEADALS